MPDETMNDAQPTDSNAPDTVNVGADAPQIDTTNSPLDGQLQTPVSPLGSTILAPDLGTSTPQPPPTLSGPQGQPPPPPAKPETAWQTLLKGALAGLSNSGGAKNFAQGLGAGVQGEQNAERVAEAKKQQDLQNQRQAKIDAENSQRSMDEHQTAQSNLATQHLEQIRIANAIRTGPKDFQDKLAQDAQEESVKLGVAAKNQPGAVVVGHYTDLHEAQNALTATMKADANKPLANQMYQDANGEWDIVKVPNPQALNTAPVDVPIGWQPPDKDNPNGKIITQTYAPGTISFAQQAAQTTNAAGQRLDAKKELYMAQQKADIEAKKDIEVDKAKQQYAAKNSQLDQVAYDPTYVNPDGSKGANIVTTTADAQARGLTHYKSDSSTLNGTIAGFNDVQQKLNQLAAVANDPVKMNAVQGPTAAVLLKEGYGIELGAFGTKVDLSNVNTAAYEAQLAHANQATRDYVVATVAAHEAITQLPRLQTFGKSSRTTQQQMEAAQKMLPSPGDDAAMAAQKMASLQNTIDPLRKQVPHMPGAELLPSWAEQKGAAPAPAQTTPPPAAPKESTAGYVYDALKGMLIPKSGAPI